MILLDCGLPPIGNLINFAALFFSVIICYSQYNVDVHLATGLLKFTAKVILANNNNKIEEGTIRNSNFTDHKMVGHILQ